MWIISYTLTNPTEQYCDEFTTDIEGRMKKAT